MGNVRTIQMRSPSGVKKKHHQVKRLIGKYAPHLAGYGQQDCQVGVFLRTNNLLCMSYFYYPISDLFLVTCCVGAFKGREKVHCETLVCSSGTYCKATVPRDNTFILQ